MVSRRRKIGLMNYVPDSGDVVDGARVRHLMYHAGSARRSTLY